MSLEENKAAVRRMFEAINQQDLASLDWLMAPDFILHMHGRQKQGWEANKQFLEAEIRAFPDLHVTIEEIIAEGDLVCVRLRETATHNGEYRGLAPTGRKLSYSVAAFWRLAEAKIAEGWVTYDQLDFLKQLGAIEWKGFPDEVK
jgi:predicted ester cyclase